MHAKWPVNVLAAETGAKAVALLVTSEEEADALEEGAALVQELVHEKGLELLGFGCLSNPDNEMVRTAMAGALLQAAAMKVPVMLDGVAVCKAAKKAADMHLPCSTTALPVTFPQSRARKNACRSWGLRHRCA